jgi:putative peptidoglycan lipid II flippase
MADRRSRSTLGEVGRSAVILTGAQVVVQAIGIVRQIILASRVGISSDLDAFIIGLTLPTTLSLVLLSGCRVALVPAYFEARDQGGMPAAKRLAGAVMVWLSGMSLIVSLCLFLFANALASLTGPGLDAAAHTRAVGYLQLLAPLAFVSTAIGILLAVSQAEQRFRLIAIVTVVPPMVTLIVMLAAWDQAQLEALAVGSLVGPVVGLILLVFDMARMGILPGLHLDARGLGIPAFVRHATPLTVSAVILQANTIGDNAIASLLAPGAVSALRYADSLIRLPISAVQNAWGTAVYPALVRATRGTGGSTLADTTMLALRYVLAIFVPLAMLTAAVAPLAVSVAYGWGAFTTEELILTAQILAGFAPLIVVLMVVPIYTGAFNARRNGMILLVGGVTNVTLNLTLDVVLGLTLGVVGLGIASSVSQTAVVVMWTWRFAHTEPGFDTRQLGRTLGLSFAASIPSAFVIGLVVWAGQPSLGLVAGLAFLIAAGALGLLSYAGLSGRLGLREPRELAGAILGWLLHRSQPRSVSR